MTWLISLVFHLNPALLAAVEHIESRGAWTAKSSAGCIGVMQVCPRFSPVKPNWLLWIPVINRAAGAHALSYWHKRAHGNWSLALAAYNCGNAGLRGRCGRGYARRVLSIAANRVNCSSNKSHRSHNAPGS